MRIVIALFVLVALIGLAWFLLTQSGIIPETDIPINIFDKEAVGEWFAEKLKEIPELAGYEAGAIYDK